MAPASPRIPVRVQSVVVLYLDTGRAFVYLCLYEYGTYEHSCIHLIQQAVDLRDGSILICKGVCFFFFHTPFFSNVVPEIWRFACTEEVVLVVALASGFASVWLCLKI